MGGREPAADHRIPDVAPAYPGALGPERPELRAFRDDVLSTLGDGAHARVDVRSPAEYTGELVAPPHLPQEQAQVPGHIPGSANVPWALAAREDGSFKSDDELRELYAEVGVTADKQVTAYCRIGERSSHTWFVLHELLEYPESATTTAPGPSTAASSASRSSARPRDRAHRGRQAMYHHTSRRRVPTRRRDVGTVRCRSGPMDQVTGPSAR